MNVLIISTVGETDPSGNLTLQGKADMGKLAYNLWFLARNNGPHSLSLLAVAAENEAASLSLVATHLKAQGANCVSSLLQGLREPCDHERIFNIWEKEGEAKDIVVLFLPTQVAGSQADYAWNRKLPHKAVPEGTHAASFPPDTWSALVMGFDYGIPGTMRWP